MPTSSGITCQCQGDPTLLPNSGVGMGAAGRLQGHSRTWLTHPGKVAPLCSEVVLTLLSSALPLRFLKCRELYPGTSLGVQWFRLHISNAGGSVRFNPRSGNYDPSWFTVWPPKFFLILKSCILTYFFLKIYSLIKLTKVKTCILSFIKCTKNFKVQLDAKEKLFPFQNQINKTEASNRWELQGTQINEC